MTTTDTGRSLLNAILDAPDDDFHRLVYADWLEENGQEERAEFIRVQCELAKWTDSDGYMPMGLDREKLQGKERGLLLGVLSPFSWIQLAGEHDHLTFRRGFIDEIHCSLDDWLTHMAAIMSQHPVQRVVVTGKDPATSPSNTDNRDSIFYRASWWHGRTGTNHPAEPHWIPSDVFACMEEMYPGAKKFSTGLFFYSDTDSGKQAALDALSTALIQMGYNAARKLTEESAP